MVKVLGMDAAQFLTVFFAVALIIPIWACYRYDIYDQNASSAAPSPFVQPDSRFAAFIQAWNVALGYYFAAYALVTQMVSTDKRSKDMYKWLVVLIAIVSWAFVIARPIGGGNTASPYGAGNLQLDSVAKNVFGNLAAGSLFALPVALLS
jgi:hypothetical protein